MVLISMLVGAFPLGAANSGRNTAEYSENGAGCEDCHYDGGANPSVLLQSVATAYNQGATDCMNVRISGTYAGFNAYATGGTISTGGAYSSNTKVETGSYGTEATHTARKLNSGGYVYFSWCWTAPNAAGTYTISAWGNRVNGDGTAQYDAAAKASQTVCVRSNPTTEICDNIDNDCDGSTDEGCDDDNDNYCDSNMTVVGTPSTCTFGGGDCNDGNFSIKPSATEICDGVNNNCSGGIDEGCDNDNDNYCDSTMIVSGTPPTCTFGGGDCNDTNASINPGQVEVCDNIDNDCNGSADDGFDVIVCGVGECQRQVSECDGGQPEMCVPGDPDREVCDGKDNDCDGKADNGIPLSTCGVGECANVGTTCSEKSCTPKPATAEVCDGKDNDCDGKADNGVPMATCGLGACQRTGTTCFAESCTPGPKMPEVCDAIDNDCDGAVDNGWPLAVCGVGECATTGSSCLPGSCIPLEPQAEICDGKDNDCDGVVDNGCDDDNDGYCDVNMVFVESPLCPSGGGDCDDLRADTHPDALELCDGGDNDCDSEYDEEITEPTCGIGACRAVGTACVEGVAENCTPLDPEPEVCDGKDNDCDGIIDNDVEPIRCGVGECAVEIVGCRAGETTECTPLEPGVEACDGLDNDCDGDVDEDDDLCMEGVCVAGECLPTLVSVGGASSTGDLHDLTQPLALGGGGFGGSDNDVLQAGSQGESPRGSSGDDGGCGCRVVGGGQERPGHGPAGAFALLGLLGVVGWRRRRQRVA